MLRAVCECVSHREMEGSVRTVGRVLESVHRARKGGPLGISPAVGKTWCLLVYSKEGRIGRGRRFVCLPVSEGEGEGERGAED